MKASDHRQCLEAELLCCRLVGAAAIAFDLCVRAERFAFYIAEESERSGDVAARKVSRHAKTRARRRFTHFARQSSSERSAYGPTFETSDSEMSQNGSTVVETRPHLVHVKSDRRRPVNRRSIMHLHSLGFAFSEAPQICIVCRLGLHVFCLLTFRVFMKNVECANKKLVRIVLLVAGKMLGMLPNKMQHSLRHKWLYLTIIKFLKIKKYALSIFSLIDARALTWKIFESSHIKHKLALCSTARSATSPFWCVEQIC